MTPHLCDGGSRDLQEVTHGQVVLEHCRSHCLNMAPSHREGQKDRYLCLSPSVMLVANFLLCIYNGKEQHLEKIRLNLGLEPHTINLHALCYSWLGKCLFFLKNLETDCHLYSFYHFLSLHLANRQSQHTGSQLSREDCTCLILSKVPGNGNCSAQPSPLLSRSIWIFSSLSYELGTCSKVFDSDKWNFLSKKNPKSPNMGNQTKFSVS